MPPIRSQTVNADGFSLETQTMGLLEVVISVSGNTHTIICKKDGAVLQEPTITNATASAVESVINNFMNGQILGAGALKPFYNACHIYSLSPLKFVAITQNTPITGEWWPPNG